MRQTQGGTSLNHRWTRFVRDRLRTSPRAIVEFAVVAGVFALADPTLTSLVVGSLVSGVGEALRIAAAGYGYNVGETALRGPYRFVRHPYFLGSALLFLGLCVAGRNVYLMGAAAIGLTLVYRLSYQRDEERMARYLGPRFAEYRERVAAFLPQLLPVSQVKDDNHGFSLEYALLRGRHRELDALLGLALAFGLLYLCFWTTAKDVFHGGISLAVGVYLLGRFVYYATSRRSKRPHSLATGPR